MRNTLLFVIVALALIAFIAGPRWKQAQRIKQMEERVEQEFAPFGKTTDEILEHENPTNGFAVWSALSYRIGQKRKAKGESSLTATERNLVAATWVGYEVNNGGFDQYFYNSSGDEAAQALAGLKEMGADGSAALLARAMAVFPDGQPPADRDRRVELMEKIALQSKPVWDKCDEEFYKLKEDIDGLTLAHARKHRAEIILP